MKVRNTLKKNSDFRRLYAKGKSAVNPWLVVYCRRNRGGVNRLGYTVSVKLGHAVVRSSSPARAVSAPNTARWRQPFCSCAQSSA